MKTLFLLIVGILFASQPGFTQHEHPHPTAKDTVPAKNQKTDASKTKPSGTKRMEHRDHSMHDVTDMKSMSSHAFSRNLPMNRNSSGTAWNPDASPMYMWMK